MYDDARDYPPGVTVPPYIPGRMRAVRPGARSAPGGFPGPTGSPMPAGGGFMGGGGITVALQPPTWVRPPGARDFTLAGTFPNAQLANTPANIPGVAFQIPNAQVGVIRSAVFLVNGLLTTSDIRFFLSFNAGPVEGWNDVYILPLLAAASSTAYGPDETAIEVPEAATITAGVRVLDAGTYQVSVSLHGWYYPKELGQAFDAAYQL